MSRNPHNWMSRLNPGELPAEWECQYCGEIGTAEQLETVECSYEYPPCKSCGQTPTCAPDCTAIAAILSSPGVHVVTEGSA